MAAAPESVFNKINEHLTCQICLETYKQPKTLPCQHTFCCKCIADYVQKQLLKRAFPCPACRQATDVPAGGVKAFPTNFLIQNIIQEVDQGQGPDDEEQEADKTPSCCESCESYDTPVVAFCEDCESHMCSECVEAHARLKMTRDHTINRMEQDEVKKSRTRRRAKQKDSAKENSRQLSVGDDTKGCSQHNGQDFSCFCLNCSTPLCSTCLTELISKKKNAHTGHNILPTAEAVISVTNEFEKQLAKVDEACAEATQDVAVTAELENALQSSYSDIVADINDTAEHLKTIVDRWVENMTKKANVLRHEREEELVTRIRTIQGVVTKLKSGGQSVRDKIKNSGDQIIYKRAEIKLQLSQLSHVYSSKDQPRPIAFSLTQVLDDTTAVRLHSMLGDIALGNDALAHGDSVGSLVSDLSVNTDPELAQLNIKTAVVCSYRPIKGKLTGLSITRAGHLLMVDNESKNVFYFTFNDKYRFTMRAKFGDTLSDPLDVAQLPDGRIVVSDGKAGHAIKVFEPTQERPPTWRRSGNIAHGILTKATGIATTADNQILISDVDRQTVQRLQLMGGDKFKVNLEIHKFKDQLQFDSPQFLACSPFNGDIAVSDRNNSCVKVYLASGRFKFRYGVFGYKARQMRKPGGVCFDARGRLYICDVLNQRIHILDPEGKLIHMISVKKTCTKFLPPPDMCAITSYGDLFLANEQGSIKILRISF